jgi:hypothetical protein
MQKLSLTLLAASLFWLNGASLAQKKSLPPPAGRSAYGHPIDRYGNRLGPSGKPMIHTSTYSTMKAAKDAARQQSWGNHAPVRHNAPKVGSPHYHPSNRSGVKQPGSTHYSYPPRYSRK